jgi:hypothetical protein
VWSRGEALVLAILDGHHALYKVGRRLEERGIVALLQPGLTRASLNDYRLGHILDALFVTNLNTVELFINKRLSGNITWQSMSLISLTMSH